LKREQPKGEACTIVNPLEWSLWIFAFIKEKGVGRKTEKKKKISTQLREREGLRNVIHMGYATFLVSVKRVCALNHS